MTTKVAWKRGGPTCVEAATGNNELPVYQCDKCGRYVTWLESHRTGKWYLVNVDKRRFNYRRNDFHGKCKTRKVL